MKKYMAILLVLLLSLSAVAMAATTPTDMQPVGNMTNATASDLNDDAPYAAAVTGLVTGWTEDGSMLIHSADGMDYAVRIDPDVTDFADAAFIQLGDYVIVYYDGRLTRSIPAQLTAGYVGSFRLLGIVAAVDEDGQGFLMADGEDTYHVALNDVPVYSAPREGQTVIVYHDGKLTRSIPAQINALYLRTVDLVGEIIAVNDAADEGEVYSILMRDETLGEVLVRIPADARVYTEANPGEMVYVMTTGMMTMSLPAQTVAVEVLPLAAPAM